MKTGSPAFANATPGCVAFREGAIASEKRLLWWSAVRDSLARITTSKNHTTPTRFSEIAVPAFNALSAFTARTRVDRSKSVTMLQLIRPRIVGVRIIVEPFARLPPVPPRHHQPLQQRRGSEPPLLKLVIHHVSNVKRTAPWDIHIPVSSRYQYPRSIPRPLRKRGRHRAGTAPAAGSQ